MNTNPSVRCTPDMVQIRLTALPASFRASVVGTVFAQIMGLLDDKGYAPLDAVLAALYPNIDHKKARSILSTQVANRAYTNAAGQAPLGLCITRKSKHSAEPQQVWFEAAVVDLPSDAPLELPRYEAAQFTSGNAQVLTKKELDNAVQQLDKQPAKKYSLAVQQAINQSLIQDGKEQLNNGLAHPQHGLAELDTSSGGLGTGSIRAGTDTQDFVPTHANLSQLTEQGITDAQGHALGKTVVCLDALLDWACDTQPKAPRLLALLGDYGTGKTSHAMQLDRVLNGLVPAPSSIGHLEHKPKVAMIDLALLAGINNLAYLSLIDLLTVALNKRRSGAVIDAPTLIAQARAGAVVMVYDGLDELLKHNEGQGLHNVLDQLLRVLEPDPLTQKASKAKVLVSCRTHYFRDLQTQHAFFDARRRGIAQVNDYLCLTLLPWDTESVQAYLGKRLSLDEAEKLYGVIKTTYNLSELASRPVLLSMMCEQVGQLLREKDRKSTRLNSSHALTSRMPSSA